jgi:DNA-binding NtrC family response regulator
MRGLVLLYEDDRAIREFVAEVLSDEGHQVLVCNSLQAVQRAAEADPCALALVDTWDARFYRLAAPQRQAIRSLAERVPTVMLTTHAWALETRAEELGLLALVPMPVDLDQLVATVGLQLASVIARWQAAQDGCADRDPKGHQLLMEKEFPRQATVVSSQDLAALAAS